MKNFDRALIAIVIVVVAVSAYGNYRHRLAMNALTKSNLMLIKVLLTEQGAGA